MAQERPLTDDEIHAIREIIKKDERMKWLGTVLRNTAVWIVAVIGGVTLAYESVANAVRHLAGK